MPVDEKVIEVSEVAQAKIAIFLAQALVEDSTLVALRVAVQPGGCSGLRYSLYLDNEIKETDNLFDYGEVKVVVDKLSAPYLRGATLDYTDGLNQNGFVFNNPNAQGSCACGDSFH